MQYLGWMPRWLLPRRCYVRLQNLRLGEHLYRFWAVEFFYRRVWVLTLNLPRRWAPRLWPLHMRSKSAKLWLRASMGLHSLRVRSRLVAIFVQLIWRQILGYLPLRMPLRRATYDLPRWYIWGAFLLRYSRLQVQMPAFFLRHLPNWLLFQHDILLMLDWLWKCFIFERSRRLRAGSCKHCLWILIRVWSLRKGLHLNPYWVFG